ncbi:MAG: hypothetical protein COT71_02245 [Candidatus Andersenbacteria bacterium CG10_big_fil_rev_8_21_14_0_10_54_11]|uniref:Polymerase beta nucleotidyltransferase domain-containing protein n=1 Tax=Candidatus Andersenbacteria bacterium CG10_big_fil_rev_8_21_14_0_10_54_11 TaxID=1974485 RepID=A0A2M6WZC9_9BACT|nr:MAG: hypothetical protein COT71_02245 [Candidatus Andersenbacteria bacterium CG10_big_fil_rev_8_21_14_0_10_54_11]
MTHLTAQEKKALQLFKQRLLAQLPNQIEELKLFGSKARGESNKFSDMDVWVVVIHDSLPVRNTLYKVASQIMLETDIDISLHVFSAAHIRSMQETGSPLLMNVKREGMSL